MSCAPWLNLMRSVAPELPRAFEAGLDGLDFIAFGRHFDADGEPVDDDWVG